jgi:hypothetical protein
MHTNTKLMGLFLVSLGFAQQAQAQSEVVEVPLTRVFIQPQGYDDNDNVEVIVDGELPNTCYTLEKQEVIHDPQTNEIRVQQRAIHRLDGVCAQDASDTPQMQTTVPFTESVDLGQLPATAYRLIYEGPNGEKRERSFEVALATAASPDSLPYAMVTELSIQDIGTAEAPSFATISGLLNNSCYSFNDEVTVDRQGDVIVLLPTVTVQATGPCLMYVRPFTKRVELGTLSAERYLVQARSMNGKSLNRVFNILPESRSRR